MIPASVAGYAMSIRMTDFVASIRAFEHMGDTPLAVDRQRPASALGHSFALSDPEQQAQTGLINTILKDIRNTQGLDASHASFAERYFGDLAAKGIPITGMAVAKGLSALVHNLQMQGSSEVMKMSLEQFAAYLGSRPESTLVEADIDPNVCHASDAQLAAVIEGNTEVIAVSSPGQGAGEADPVFARAQDFLLDMKDALGGSPNFPNGPPHFSSESRRFVTGSTHETMAGFFQQWADDPNARFPALWSRVASFFRGTPQPLSAYEQLYLNIESLRLLSENYETIKAAYERSAAEGDEALKSITRLTPHSEQNGGASGAMEMIDGMLHMFRETYAVAEQEGTQYDFCTEALSDACMPDRHRTLAAHYTRTVLNAESLDPPPITEYDPRNPRIDVGQAAALILAELEDAPGTWEEAKAVLLGRMGGHVHDLVDASGNAVRNDARAVDDAILEGYVRGILVDIAGYPEYAPGAA